MAMKIRKTLAAVLLFFTVFSFLSHTETAMAADKNVWVMKLSHDNAETHQWHTNAVKFAELIKEGTNGAIEVQIYSGGQLGDIRTICESLITGNIEFCINGGGYLGNYADAYQILEMPYLFRDHAHMNKALSGKAGEIGNAQLAKSGLMVLSWWNRTPRQTMSSKVIEKLEDLKGLKIRVPEIDAHVFAWRAMGTNPTPITWNEVFSSAQQGIIEGVENPVSTMYDTGLQEAFKYLSLTNHCFGNAALFTGSITWNKLTPDQQKVILDAAAAVKLTSDQATVNEEIEYLKKMENAGVIVLRPDVEPFRQAALSAHNELAARYSQEFYDAVIATQ
jgi:tripartite ATP-independent transporter DctP family solute receptor